MLFLSSYKSYATLFWRKTNGIKKILKTKFLHSCFVPNLKNNKTQFCFPDEKVNIPFYNTSTVLYISTFKKHYQRRYFLATVAFEYSSKVCRYCLTRIGGM